MRYFPDEFWRINPVFSSEDKFRKIIQQSYGGLPRQAVAIFPWMFGSVSQASFEELYWQVLRNFTGKTFELYRLYLENTGVLERASRACSEKYNPKLCEGKPIKLEACSKQELPIYNIKYV